jgi:hypothetical protein
MKVLFIFSLFLLVSSIYCQNGEIVICEDIDKNNEFVNENANKVSTNFVWYFLREDLQNVGFEEGEQTVLNLETGRIDKHIFICDKNTPCPYFEDKLEKGKYIIAINVRGKQIGKSKAFEVR